MLSLKQSVLTPHGEIPIERLKKGDKVIGINNEIQVVKKVGFFENKSNKFWYIVNGKYAFAPHQSVYSSGRLIHARQLNPGMYLETFNGSKIKIKTVKKFNDNSEKIKIEIDRPFSVLNIFRKNKSQHAYYLNGILVHNASRFWVAGAGSWSAANTANWSATSGGGTGASVPTSSDTVTFDAASNATAYTCTVTATANCSDIDFTNPASGNLTFAGSSALNVFGNFTVHSAITRTYTGQITFSATATGKTITTNAITFSSTMIFDGIGGGWTFQDNISTSSMQLTNGILDANGKTITLTGSFSVNSSATARTLTMGASTWNIASWAVNSSGNLTFNANTSAITVTPGTLAFTAAALTYNNVTIKTGSGNTAPMALTGAATFANLTFTGGTGPGTSITLANNITVTGTLTMTSNSTINRLLVWSSVPGTQITITAAILAATTNIDFQDINAAGAAAPWSGTSIGDAKGNSNITFTTPTTRFWVGNGGNASLTTHWSASSGGGSGASLPLPQDTVIFDANSITSASQTITFNMARIGKNASFTGILNSPTLDFSTAYPTIGLSIFDSLTLATGLSITGTGSTLFLRTDTASTITNSGITLSPVVGIYAFGGGSYTLQDNFISTNSISTVQGGTFDANNKNVTCKAFGSNNSTTRTINMGSGLWTFTGATVIVWNTSTTTGLTLNAGTSTIKITDATATTKQINGGGVTFNNLWITGDQILIADGNTWNQIKLDNPGTSVGTIFPSGFTQTVNQFFAQGSLGSLIKITALTAGTPATIKCQNAVVSCEYLSLKDSTATGGAKFYAGYGSTKLTGNTGWLFESYTQPLDNIPMRPAIFTPG